MIDAKQLLSFFEAEYAQDVEADEIKKGISDELKAYAMGSRRNQWIVCWSPGFPRMTLKNSYMRERCTDEHLRN